MKHQSGSEEAPPPPSPVAGWASGFFRAIVSILATAEEDYAEADVTVHAAPGLATSSGENSQLFHLRWILLRNDCGGGWESRNKERERIGSRKGSCSGEAPVWVG